MNPRLGLSILSSLVLVTAAAITACSSNAGEDDSAGSAASTRPDGGSADARPGDATTDGGTRDAGPALAAVGGPYSTPESDGTVDVIDFSAVSASDFSLTPTDPNTGLIVGAHPSNFTVRWTSMETGSVFGVGATGIADAHSCGTVTLHAGVEIDFNHGNSCGLLDSFVAAPYKSAAKDKVLDLVSGGLSFTPVNPATGLITSAHPDDYDLRWTGPTTADLSPPGSARCGQLTTDARSGAITITGCDALADVYRQR